MMKPQDILIVLKYAVIANRSSTTFDTLSVELSMSGSEVFSGVKRAAICGLLVARLGGGAAARFEPVFPAIREFLGHGIRYVFPAEIGRPVRGILTAMDAPFLRDRLPPAAGDLPMVWPDSEGDTRGLSFKPLYRTVPAVAKRDRALYEWLALADALRLGEARVRTAAAECLDRKLTALRHANA